MCAKARWQEGAVSAEARHVGCVCWGGTCGPRESLWEGGFLLSTAGALEDRGLALPTPHGVCAWGLGRRLVLRRSSQWRAWNPNFP